MTEDRERMLAVREASTGSLWPMESVMEENRFECARGRHA